MYVSGSGCQGQDVTQLESTQLESGMQLERVSGSGFQGQGHMFRAGIKVRVSGSISELRTQLESQSQGQGQGVSVSVRASAPYVA